MTPEAAALVAAIDTTLGAIDATLDRLAPAPLRMTPQAALEAVAKVSRQAAADPRVFADPEEAAALFVALAETAELALPERRR